jgi:flagellin
LESLDAEYQQLIEENNRVIAATTFNGQTVLDGLGGNAGKFTFQIGANDVAANDQIEVDSAGVTLTANATLDATTAVAQITALDDDIDTITAVRATWGASQNRFETVINNLRVGAENSAAAHGRIVDADYAQETANLTRAQVLQQAGTAMVAQANQGPNGVLALLR